MKELYGKVKYIFDLNTRMKFVILIFVTMIGAVLELLGVSAIMPILNITFDESAVEKSKISQIVMKIFGVQNVNEILLVLIFAMILIYVVKNIYLAYMNNVIFRFSVNARRKIATRLMRTYMSQSYEYFLNKNSSELIRSVSNDTQGVYETVYNVLLIASNGLISLCLIVYLAINNIYMILAILLLFAIFALTIFRTLQRKSKEYGVVNRTWQAKVYKTLQQSFSGIKEIKILNCENFFVSEFDNAYFQNASIARFVQLFGLLPKYFIETICICGVLGVMAVTIMMGGDYKLLIPQLAVFAAAAFRLMPSVNAIYNYMNTIVYNRAALDSVYNDLIEAEESKKVFEEKFGENQKIVFHKEIQVKNVSFGYNATHKNIFENANLTIKKGESIAFVGASGGGKTTLADIILGLLGPQNGSVLVDGIDIQNGYESWLSIVGYIPQVIYLTDDSIRNNVALGIREEEIDDKKVWKALEGAQMKNYVETLSKGLDAMVGERGVCLSGGQRQRIGIARALYKDPEFLVFDEATSALDNDTEKEVMNAIESLQGSKTMLIIAHRLSTIEKCDKIYKIENGQIYKEK